MKLVGSPVITTIILSDDAINVIDEDSEESEEAEIETNGSVIDGDSEELEEAEIETNGGVIDQGLI